MNSTTQMVAARVKRFRLARGFSQNELSRRSSVAKATLAQLELGRGNPTLETLMSLATHLNVTLTDLLADNDEMAVRIVRRHEGAEVRGDGLQLRCIHRMNMGSALIEIFDMQMQHGVYESPAHAEGVREHVILHEGEARIGPAGAEANLKPGDFMSFSGDCPHSYNCTVDSATATLIVIYAHFPQAPSG